MLRTLSFLLIIGIIVNAGCQPSVSPPSVSVNATVGAVRLTVKQSWRTKEKGMSPVTGAIVGGVLADTVGAVIGAAAASDGQETLFVEEIMAAKFFAKTTDGVWIEFVFKEWSTGIKEVTLLRKNDNIVLKKHGDSYYWRCKGCGWEVRGNILATSPF